MKFAVAFLTIVFAAGGVLAQNQPTLRVVTESPNLPSELFYGEVKVKPLRLRPGTNQRITIDDADFFVQQHYVDFLGRFPEAEGFKAWLGVLERCGGDQTCVSKQRVEVSAAFYRSEEFQLKGFFVYRFYAASLGRLPKYSEFMPDMQRVTAQTNDEVLAKRDQFTDQWVDRAEFKTKYGSLSNSAFVDRLLQTAGVQLPNRSDLVADLDAGRKSRAQVVRAVVESQQVFEKEFNRAFVAMQYFGYLRRDPEAEGYNAWLRVLNQNPQDFRTMVGGFVNSPEYRNRF